MIDTAVPISTPPWYSHESGLFLFYVTSVLYTFVKFSHSDLIVNEISLKKEVAILQLHVTDIFAFAY